MEEIVHEYFNNLGSTEDKIRLNALQNILIITDAKVDWIYEIWDDLFERLNHPNSYQRSIAIKVLCNLAKSDSEHHLNDTIQIILAHTKDEKFITTRQCLQNIWKLALTNQPDRRIVLDHLEKRYLECVDEKHYNLIRQDIIQSIALLSKEINDPSIIIKAQNLISKEASEKYRKTYHKILL
jgi:hypothetical protein